MFFWTRDALVDGQFYINIECIHWFLLPGPVVWILSSQVLSEKESRKTRIKFGLENSQEQTFIGHI